jgi:hypothetical protein
MTEDFVLIAVVSLVWAALAALYAFVPMFTMPGSAVVWGSGAAVFLMLALIIAIAERLMPQIPKRA